MKKIIYFLIVICVLSVNGLMSQNIAITDDDTYVANSSAMLDVKSDTKGILIPRLSTVARNAIVSPAMGLLVFDTTLNGFYYYNGSVWINLSSGSSSGLLWSYSSPNVYLTGTSDKVGIGNSAPVHKLNVTDNVTLTDGTDGSFIDIQNTNNSVGVMSGFRFQNGTTGNTFKGGVFYKDVLGYGRGDLIIANNSVGLSGDVGAADARLTIKNTGGVEVKATTGAAANSSLFHVLNAAGDTIFAVYDGGVRVNVYDDPLAKATSSKGGFAVGGFSPSKGTFTNEYLRITPDSIRMYIEEGIPNKATASKGGFAVGGFSPAKATPTDYFNIYGSNVATAVNPSDARIFWYPIKEALLAGRVIVEHADSVGLNSFSTGYLSRAKGSYSQAFGYQCYARGMYSTAIGKNAIAKGTNSFAFGSGPYAAGNDSYALGAGAIAQSNGSFAIGSQGRDSLGIQTGVNTKASGLYAIAIGQGAQSSGKGSMSYGVNSDAGGDYSLASGEYTSASSYAMTAIGRWNKTWGSATTWQYNDPLFVVGAGWTNYRANALTLLKNGTLQLSSALNSASLFFEVDRNIYSSPYYGRNLYIRAGGGGNGMTDVKGGDLYLCSGISTGYQSSNIFIQTPAAMGSGSTDRTLTTRMMISGTGNVGIGTTTPSQKLHVVGNVQATSYIATTTGAGAYKYNTTSNMNVPDYVFDNHFEGFSNNNPIYKMLDLPDLKTFVSEKRHLPRVPSRSEIEKDGVVNMQGLSMIILEKTEENTLYILQLKELIDKLDKENIEVKIENESLKSKLAEIDLLKEEIKKINESLNVK